jgi:hypothetical protein
MQVDALVVRLRPRTPMEAADLGARICQRAARDIYACVLVAALPVAGLAVAGFEVSAWLGALVIWWSKPWLDRTILFVLSRTAFGQRTTLSDLWRAQRQVWWQHLLHTWTLRRLSPWRSLTQPVYQLEGGRLLGIGARVRQIRRRKQGAGFLISLAFLLAELALTAAVLSLTYWLTPEGETPVWIAIFSGETPTIALGAFTLAYGSVVLFLEPFYVAAGFALYLTRRAELEAWDIEQEFRRAFA